MNAAEVVKTLAKIRKTLVVVLGICAMAVSAGLVHGTALAILNGILAAATALGVYHVPNAVKKPAPPA